MLFRSMGRQRQSRGQAQGWGTAHSLLVGTTFLLLSWVVFKAGLVRDDSWHSIVAALYCLSALIYVIGFEATGRLRIATTRERLMMVISLSLALTAISNFLRDTGIFQPFSWPADIHRGMGDMARLASPKGRQYIEIGRAHV